MTISIRINEQLYKKAKIQAQAELRTILKGISIIEPPVSVLELLKFKVKSINNQNLLNQKQIQTLTKLRNTLLPKLISGKIRVSNE